MKIIYRPKGAALEYATYACNLFTGCSGGCSYCYNKKGITTKVLGADKPTLRKCFEDENDALKKFYFDVNKNIDTLKINGLFFSFVGDPMCKEQMKLTENCIKICVIRNIDVTILTKQTDWINHFDFARFDGYLDRIIFGVTLTGCDELEKGCPSSDERIKALKFIREQGFTTWVSLEPCIDIERSMYVFCKSNPYVRIYKIGMESGKKYSPDDIHNFVTQLEFYNKSKAELIFKESIKKYL